METHFEWQFEELKQRIAQLIPYRLLQNIDCVASLDADTFIFEASEGIFQTYFLSCLQA